jgi:hypothetical protein
MAICGSSHSIKSCSNGDTFLASQDYFAALEAYMVMLSPWTLPNKKPLLSRSQLPVSPRRLSKGKGHTTTCWKRTPLYEHRCQDKTRVHLRIATKPAQSHQDITSHYRKIFPGNPSYLRKLGNLFQQGNEPTQALQSYSRCHQTQ